MKLLPEITEMYLMIERNKALSNLDKENEKVRKLEKKINAKQHKIISINSILDIIQHNLNVLEKRKTLWPQPPKS